MIRTMSHATIYVLDLDRAKKFYTEKLGFECRNDVTMDDMGGFRWLTVAAPNQTGLEIVLMPAAAGPTMDADAASQLRGLIERGLLGAGVFQTADCRKTYDELTAKGVTFRSEPTERPYGIEAIFCDDSGNWFSLTQPRG
ncbi:MAG: VOC family protein [Labilithrix sp.]|nr:VOC family protein [Labilithrix sp.]